MVHSPSLALALAVPTKNVLICKVVKVTDGDTITVLTDNNEQERIRLWGIDAPEQRGAQPYWKTSRDQLAVMDALESLQLAHIPWDRFRGKVLGCQKGECD